MIADSKERGLLIKKMLEEGLEPSRGCPHRILNPARLPIPPPEPGARSGRHVPANSGAEGNRTPDLLNAIQALSQLSYGPITRHPPSGADSNLRFSINCSAGLTRLELATSGVTDRHSNRLSYSPLVLPFPAILPVPRRGIEPRLPG
jgi:hypothetical protein